MNIKKIFLLGLLFSTISQETQTMGLNKDTLVVGGGIAAIAAISWYGINKYYNNHQEIDLEENLEEDLCSVCYDSMTTTPRTTTLTCHHTHKFHTECIRQVIKHNFSQCPLCKNKIDPLVFPELYAEDFYEDILPDIKTIALSSAIHSFTIIIPYAIIKNLEFYYDLNFFQTTLICAGLFAGFDAGLEVYRDKIMISKKRETLCEYANYVALATGLLLGYKILSSQIHININAHSGKATIAGTSFIFTGIPPRLLPELNSQFANYLKAIAAS
ncbi:E3 ubiquitin protein ligase [Candidatus Babeliales bacterium]|nr:E3 ubiquitin protein ligase [Candidatus Babeliales bacterium]